tara:strand:+ start:641 stop:1219 length:579 start_codon:yes stop_codon:yes gene_type:complete
LYNPNKKPINKSRIPEMEMKDEWIRAFLQNSKVGNIASIDGDQPFIVPTSFWYSKKKNQIYFHSNAFGRLRYNVENNPKVCFVSYDSGRLLPSNIALEKSFQYKCVIVFGIVDLIKSDKGKQFALGGLLKKYFGEMIQGKDYRPVTKNELKQTSVYSIKIKSWSGKKNWPKKADQAKKGEWPDLDPKWFDFY